MACTASCQKATWPQRLWKYEIAFGGPHIPWKGKETSTGPMPMSQVSCVERSNLSGSRISVLHGRPVSVSPAEIDAPMPMDLPALRPMNRLTNLPNFIAVIGLTNHLAKASKVIRALRRCQRTRKKNYLRQLAATRDQLSSYWDSLPTEIHCRDLGHDGPFFRCNVHIEIYYTTTMIYMGRPFIIPQASSRSPQPNSGDSTIHEVPDIVSTLRKDSLSAAFRVIELCQLLQDSVGLARASYTEFNGCRVALLALIAHSIIEPTRKISSALTQGMCLIRQICAGLESARSDVAVIEVLELARQRLHSHTNAERRQTEDAAGYDQFKEWAKLWRAGPVDGSDIFASTDMNPTPEQHSPHSGFSFDGFFSSFPNELGEFAAIPGLNYDLALAGSSEWIMD